MVAGLRQCVKTVSIHSSAILSIKAGDQWLAIGAADNSMSLFHRLEQRPGVLVGRGDRMAGWQLYRTPQRSAAVVLSFLSWIYCFTSLVFFWQPDL
jgi:hypothetical protein